MFQTKEKIAVVAKITALLLIMFMLSSCAHKPRAIYSDQCLAMQRQYKLSQKLGSENIQVIKTGEEITLILPSNDYFPKNSNNLYNSSAKKLNLVIQFINSYPVDDVQVKGFTTAQGDYRRNLALSRGQANRIAHYLWHYGVNSRLVSANGYGCHMQYNFNHLEIFFRLPPPDNVFH